MAALNIGVIGTGTISSSLVTGFCTASHTCADLHFYLSPRGTEKAAALAEAYPEQVTVCSSNQDVIDASEWVILSLLPRHAADVLPSLTFRPEQKILTLMSDHFIETVRGWTGPVAKIVRMVPLPFAAMHIGPIASFPADEEIRELFRPLGQLIELEKETELSVISGLTAIMSSYYLLVHEVSQWGARQGLPEKAALDYMTAFFEALSVKARAAKDGDVYRLAYEMTPGGINEMALHSLLGKNAFEVWCQALDEVMERLNKKKIK